MHMVKNFTGNAVIVLSTLVTSTRCLFPLMLYCVEDSLFQGESILISLLLLHNNFTASPPNSNHKNNSAYNRPNAYKQKGCKMLYMITLYEKHKSSYSLYLFNQRVTFTPHLHTCNLAYILFNSITYCFHLSCSLRLWTNKSLCFFN